MTEDREKRYRVQGRAGDGKWMEVRTFEDGEAPHGDALRFLRRLRTADRIRPIEDQVREPIHYRLKIELGELR